MISGIIWTAGPWDDDDDEPEPNPAENIYLDVIESGEGYVLYEGAGLGDTIGFTNGEGITEIEILGSRSEESTPYIRFINPVNLQSYEENELTYKTVFGVTDTPDADIRVNGRKAIVSGNIFWVKMQQLHLRDYGLQELTASITDDEGRTSSYTTSIIVQSDRYWITLDQGESLYYTRDNTFRISGKANKWCNNVYINDSYVPINSNNYSYDVPLEEGLNLIEVKFTDRWTNKVVSFYIKKVYMYSGEILLDVKNPVDGMYINESETYVSGYARGAGLASVTVNGAGATIKGSSFCSKDPVPLSDAENTITITATDKTGYQTTKTITVYRDIIPPEISDVTTHSWDMV